MNHEFSMKTIFYTVSVFMIIAWAISYFVYAMKAPIHGLLLSAALLGLAGYLEKK